MPIRKKVNKDFFKRWSKEMSYVLGFFAADGNLIINKNGSNYFSFYSADRYILSLIKKALGSEHKLSKRSIRSGHVYRFQIGSKVICSDLLLLGFTPLKSRRMKMPIVPNEYINDFIRGYFDGDGNVWSGYMKRKNSKSTLTLQVAFTSGSSGFLKDLWKTLKLLGVNGGSFYPVKNKECSRLSFGVNDALKLYKIMYNEPHKLYLTRKKLVFEKFIKMRL